MQFLTQPQTPLHPLDELLSLRAVVEYHFRPNWLCTLGRISGGAYGGTLTEY
jgi:hypothetical protein